jgi:pectinesterase
MMMNIPPQGSQAIALSIDGTRFGGYGIKLTGYQDTLLTNKGYHFIGKSYIGGATDFVSNSSVE